MEMTNRIESIMEGCRTAPLSDILSATHKRAVLGFFPITKKKSPLDSLCELNRFVYSWVFCSVISFFFSFPMEIIIKAEKRVHQFICCGIYNGNNVGVFMRLSSSAHSARFARQLFWKRKRRKWISGLTRRTQSRISHNKQEAALKKDIPYALLYATKKSLFLFWQEEIEIERVRERERRERMIGNEMKTNKVHNIMIIVAYIFPQKFFTAFWGKWVERDAQHTIRATRRHCYIA